MKNVMVLFIIFILSLLCIFRINERIIVAHAQTPVNENNESVTYAEGDLDYIKTIAYYVSVSLIAIGVLFALVMAPYIGYLLASGNPENIKSAHEWIKAIVYGFILLVFSGTIVSIIGSDILGL